MKVSKAAPGSLQNILEERAELYKTAIRNAKAAAETSKARRYDRGLKVGLKMDQDDEDLIITQGSLTEDLSTFKIDRV